MQMNNSLACLCHNNDSCSIEAMQSKKIKSCENIRDYRRRFWMLFLFCSLSMLCGMLFPQFSSMADVTMCFYGVSSNSVNWTCLIVMVVYIALVFPVSLLMETVGLKVTIILGSICNTIACAVQFAILTPESFTFVIVVAFFTSLSNVLVLAIPPCLAATWFPSNELSRACAMGVFGNQLGVAMGFIFSPMLVTSDCSNKDLIAEGKRNVALILTTVNTIVLLLTIFTFQNKPALPPSIAQAEKKEIKESYIHSALSMARNGNFCLIMVMYGLIVGTYFAIATVLNNLLSPIFPNSDVAIGWMGMLIIVTGLVGSVVAGFILDYTHKFKETSVAICFLSFILHVVFSCLLLIHKLWIQFVTISIYGFFLTSFLPVGFEYGIEVTYPQSEITSAGLLNSSTMVFGIIITEISSYALENLGPNYANGVLGVALLTGSIIACLLTKNYKRSKKNNVILTTPL